MTSWEHFVADLNEATSVWLRAPLVPALAIVLTVVTSGIGTSEPTFVLMATVIPLITVGFFGAQRLAFQRALEARPASLPLLLEATGAYFGRFAALGILVVLAGFAISIAAFFTAAALFSFFGFSFILWVVVWVVVPLLVIDVFLTFVTPALVFTTKDVGTAWRIGRTMLRETWDETRYHALVPPLVVLAVGQALSPSSPIAGVVVAVLGALLAVIARGAQTLAYLRHHRPTAAALPRSMRS